MKADREDPDSEYILSDFCFAHSHVLTSRNYLAKHT